jgi:hypothetical protein
MPFPLPRVRIVVTVGSNREARGWQKVTKHVEAFKGAENLRVQQDDTSAESVGGGVIEGNGNYRDDPGQLPQICQRSGGSDAGKRSA